MMKRRGTWQGTWQTSLSRKRITALVVIIVMVIVYMLNDAADDASTMKKGVSNISRKKQKGAIDFIIAGYAKCGTTTLLSTLARMKEVDMAEHEYCNITQPNKPIEQVWSEFHTYLDENHAPPSPNKKRGLKCPTAVRHPIAIDRLEELNPDIRVVVGLRHPVLFFQSYYNYRISHRKRMGKNVPDPYDLIGGHALSYQGVFTDLARFEDGLMLYGKSQLSTKQLKRLASEKLEVSPASHAKIMLYEVGQLGDVEDPKRAQQFRDDLTGFLGLKERLQSYVKRNVNSAKQTYPETMNICKPKYDELRKVMLKNAQVTQQWIRDEFVKSPDVVIGGSMDHFLELISGWTKDPCKSQAPVQSDDDESE
jgi:hypothetical protein